jgi:hypothetical protein
MIIIGVQDPDPGLLNSIRVSKAVGSSDNRRHGGSPNKNSRDYLASCIKFQPRALILENFSG